MGNLPHVYKYLRDKNRNPYGVVCAVIMPCGKVVFGLSLCNIDKGDRFEKKKGITIAYGRACNPRTTMEDVPSGDLIRWGNYAKKRLAPRV